MITIGSIQIDGMVQTPMVTPRFRARSVVYALDGTAKEDRLGDAKKMLTLPFVLISSDDWSRLNAAISAETITVNGLLGGYSLNGTYRLSGNDFPMPVLYQDRLGKVMCQPFTVVLEEI